MGTFQFRTCKSFRFLFKDNCHAVKWYVVVKPAVKGNNRNISHWHALFFFAVLLRRINVQLANFPSLIVEEESRWVEPLTLVNSWIASLHVLALGGIRFHSGKGLVNTNQKIYTLELIGTLDMFQR